ncbi:hypothetical protein DL96DRAFT_1607513 [Flagelloscypha sp. PMI_526]|nr:hypothetical protein DL96DRAFT_1607513 [Flagelloscypha sp. PMI_526]
MSHLSRPMKRRRLQRNYSSLDSENNSLCSENTSAIGMFPPSEMLVSVSKSQTVAQGPCTSCSRRIAGPPAICSRCCTITCAVCSRTCTSRRTNQLDLPCPHQVPSLPPSHPPQAFTSSPRRAALALSLQSNTALCPSSTPSNSKRRHLGEDTQQVLWKVLPVEKSMMEDSHDENNDGCGKVFCMQCCPEDVQQGHVYTSCMDCRSSWKMAS